MTSPLLALSGAFPADPPDDAVAAHYGDPFAEQRLLASGAGYVDLSHRDVVTVTGADRLTWLHSLTSQHLEALAPGVAAEALVLSPHGHVEHHLALVDDGTTTWLHVEPGSAEALLTYLHSMVFWSKVEPAAATASYAVLHVAAEPAQLPDGAVVRRLPDGIELFIPRPALTDVAGALGPPAGIWALEALRIAAGVPRFGFETDHRTIPHEVGWIGPAVHLDKGCYRGQETVARVHNLGRPPRRLVLLHLDGSEAVLPARGSAVLLDGREVGRVTTSGRHYELGPIALAVVKRSVDPGAALAVDGVAAGQEMIVAA